MATTTQARPGSRAPRSPYYDPNAEAKIFLAILGSVFLAAVFYIAYARLHFRLEQLIEISFYLVALFIVIWDSPALCDDLPEGQRDELAASSIDRRAQE